MNVLEINLSSVNMTDEQFYDLCQDNRDLRFERNAKGDLIFKRWINHGYSMVFTPFAYSSKDSLYSITEKDGKIIREKK